MFDLREEIIFLSEESLHHFIKDRIDSLNYDEKWKEELKIYVNENYKEHPENLEKIHSFLSEHSVEDIDVDVLDITASTALLLFFEDFKKLYNEGYKDKVKKAFKSKLYDFQNARNNLRHYTAKISEKDKVNFLLDQLDAINCVIGFSLLCERNCKSSENWKRILVRAYYYQDLLRRERYFLFEKDLAKDLSPESDFSDIESLAENGDVSAQVILGKMYYEGNRVKHDPGKAFLWFYKAAIMNNAEAMYYVGMLYQGSLGVNYDNQKSIEFLKKSAEMGFVPAQYKYSTRSWAKVNSTEEEKKEMAEALIKIKDSQYPPALWTLALCYEMGIGVEKNKEESHRLKEEAALLGNIQACEELAEESRRNKDEASAKKWYEIAAKNDSEIAISALERYKEKGHF